MQFSGTLVIIAYNMAAAILRCLGDSRTPLIAIALATGINIGLDLLFVLVFHWGIFGAAIATVIAQVFSFLACLVSVSYTHLYRNCSRTYTVFPVCFSISIMRSATST